MQTSAKIISSLYKIRSEQDVPKSEIKDITVFKKERYSFQMVLTSSVLSDVTFKISKPYSDYLKIYSVRDVVMDYDMSFADCDDYYLSKSTGSMPDVLVPINGTHDFLHAYKNVSTVWFTLELPSDFDKSEFNLNITVDFKRMNSDGSNPKEDNKTIRKKLAVNVINQELAEPNLKVTHWFYVDAIAEAYDIPVYSNFHWNLINKYMAAYRRQGNNMILTPVITPPLDTAVGTERLNVQLARIYYDGNDFKFDWDRLEQFVELAQFNGIEYFEICPLFSQWGAKYTPNIYVWYNDALTRMFGWDKEVSDPLFQKFLDQFLKSLRKCLVGLDILDKCYFHVSDEPVASQLEAYKSAMDIIESHFRDCKRFDALSDYEFYKTGVVKTPVCATNHIKPFIENNVPDLWAYYCTAQADKVSNHFIGMPSARTRIIGLQMYRFNVKGFLHWGFNFFYSHFAGEYINPLLSTTCLGTYPSGEAHTVYPDKNGVLYSLRGEVFFDALQDFAICEALEQKIGKSAVDKLIDEFYPGFSFEDYPHDDESLLLFINSLKEKLK